MGSAETIQRSSPAVWGGISMKHVSLISLIVQNSALILIMYYSRIMPLIGGQRYITSTAVFLTEVVKFAICLTAALFEVSQEVAPSLPATSLFQTLASATFGGDSWKLAIPAALYTLQHSLQYVAISNLDAATLQVTYQFKILPTAIFSILVLRRSLTAQKWVALALLMFGVALVQMPVMQHPNAATALKDAHSGAHLPRSLESLLNWGSSASEGLHKRSATYEGIDQDYLARYPDRNEALGFVAAILSSTASALGSVYFEKILKEATSKVSIWVRNVQLSIYSIVPSLFIGVIFVDGENISKKGFFVGYNYVVWLVVVLQALGGIIVALAIHYTNNIAKSFATSISILLSLCLSMIFFDFTLTVNFVLGTAIVLFATYLYNANSDASSSLPRSARPPPINITSPIDARQEKPFDDRAFAIKLPLTPLKEEATTTSRPGSPLKHHTRRGSSRGSYFEGKRE